VPANPTTSFASVVDACDQLAAEEGKSLTRQYLFATHFDEPAIYKAAFAFEQAGDWKKM
jgi:hypothetical protein